MSTTSHLTVIHFLPFFGDPSGAARSMATLTGQQAGTGQVGCVLMERCAIGDILESQGVLVRYAYPQGHRPERFWSRCWYVTKAMLSLKRELNADLLHCHSSYGAKYCVAASRLGRFPWVVHIRDNWASSRAFLGAGQSQRIIAISEHVKQAVPPALQTKVRVVHNAVTIPEASEVSPRGGMESTTLTIGMAGRAVSEKGIDLLIEALRGWEAGSAKLVLWGMPEEGSGDAEDPYIRSLYEAIGRLEIEVDVQPFRVDMQNFYQQLDVVAVPSRYAEPFGRMAIESMAYGCATVVAGHGGLVEIITDGEDGLQHLPDDAEDLRRCLVRLRDEPGLRQQIARIGRENVIQKFSAETHAANIDAVYREIV